VPNLSSAEPALSLDDQRIIELATILAGGIVRLHVRSALNVDVVSPEISRKSAASCLELPEETVLSVHTG